MRDRKTNERFFELTRTSTNPENLVKITSADSEITGREVGPLETKNKEKREAQYPAVLRQGELTKLSESFNYFIKVDGAARAYGENNLEHAAFYEGHVT